jgi:phage terminase small subunit
MKPLQNLRHEQFALLVASGKSLREAFIAAGYSKANAASCALRLSKRPEVRSRIAELQQIVTQVTTTQAALDRSWILSELRQDR